MTETAASIQACKNKTDLDAVPVPGGMSMTKMSKGAHETLVMKESKADMTMGPLQTAGASSYTAHHVLPVSSRAKLHEGKLETKKGKHLRRSIRM